jgi:Reverse transcriptase (RNA-dependent DNA polymerase)
MELAPRKHVKKTEKLARALHGEAVFNWLVTKGYFPEPYVLPPCFAVTKYPKYGKEFFPHKSKKFQPRLTEYQQVHFPKTDYTDRTFGFIDPEINSDIAYTIASNWTTIVDIVFHRDNKVCCYSFPVPLDSGNFGQVGGLRSGRMIYEFIEMAENDLAAVAHRFKYLLKADVKNFYPSVYTHSIPWAIHGKSFIRNSANRHNYDFIGNRLDKLFQNSNDGCTNGLPIGPAVSDLAAEIVMAGVDRLLSKSLSDEVLVLRFKDDYRILAKTESAGLSVIKGLQAALKDYRLELNDEKTQLQKLPSGVFRGWVSQYHAANNLPKQYYSFRRFKEVYLSVLNIDKANPGCGVIDRFLADIVTKKYRLRVQLDKKSLPKVLSLLLMLGGLRTKAFPKVLATMESILRSPSGVRHSVSIAKHLDDHLRELSVKELENRYLITWIWYFLRANNLEKHVAKKYTFSDPIIRATYTSKFSLFSMCKDFKVFQGVKAASKQLSLLEHLDVFKPQ